MKNKKLFLALTILFFIAAVIDIIDGYVPKLISSIALSAGFAALTFREKNPQKKILINLAYTFFLIALSGFAYRIIITYLS
jgi:hypothetical protein